MVEFNLWGESFIFAVIFAFIILVPCVLVAFIGTRMIDRLGRYPTKTPVIQMSILVPLVAIEIVTFALMLGFYRFFSVK